MPWCWSASTGSGSNHEVACWTLALRAVAPMVLNPPAAPDASIGTNAAELESLGITSGFVAMPRAASTSPASLAAAQLVWERLGLWRLVRCRRGPACARA
ncbi:hypothetical protein [Sorangium sp. So ce1024]|uniref:hypothetical protein n=1 Tax=Sorangium sp. So ce1024 TaxID=3133327 RepID=UPI003EFDF1DA